MTAWPPLLVFTINTFFFSAVTVNEEGKDETALLGKFLDRARKEGEMEREEEREWWEVVERERHGRGEREDDDEEREEKKRREDEVEAAAVAIDD